jgi:uncharacterized coiled-coil DUF342 family protein
MTDKIKKLLDELDKIENKLIEKINQIDNVNELNDKLIELISQFPEQKQLIRFIIYINDNLSNSQTKSNDVLIDTITDLISQKKRILELIEELHKPKKKSSEKLSTLKELPYPAWVAIGTGFIALLVFLFLMFHPEKTETIAKVTTTAIIKNKGKK